MFPGQNIKVQRVDESFNKHPHRHTWAERGLLAREEKRPCFLMAVGKQNNSTITSKFKLRDRDKNCKRHSIKEDIKTNKFTVETGYV